MASTVSPPISQSEEDQIMTDPPTSYPTETLMDTPKSINVRSRAPAGEMSPPSAGAKDPGSNLNFNSGAAKEDHGEPGSCWNNQKFQEEYARAFEGLLDQKFTMAQYGDPLDPVMRNHGRG